MLVLGLQGSPRKNGNTNFLMDRFMDAAQKAGARTKVIHVDGRHIEPCREYMVCEKKGYCPIKDDMKSEIYALLWEADVVVAGTPVFFYNTTAQLKALIDRCQTLWARKYRLGLTDPGRRWRKGSLLAVGATRGQNLFEGIHLTMKYFYDAVGAAYEEGLTYRRIEGVGDMEKHPGVMEDIEKAVQRLVVPMAGRKKVLFACRENACRSQMAGAFARMLGGDCLDVFTGGTEPAEKINPVMQQAMAEVGVDMGFQTPRLLQDALDLETPDLIVTMGCGEKCPFVPGAAMQDWDLPDPAGNPPAFMREVRDRIRSRVEALIAETR
jgi:arsenate reductase (thioredoxin)